MNFTEFEEKLGYSFKDKSLLELALTHSSFANENKLKKNNERFEFLGEYAGFTLADDYAHHPDEVKACARSIKELYRDKKITALFQPHLFSRTADFYKEFAESLSLFDKVILVEIYPAREKPIPGVTSQLIFDQLGDNVEKRMCNRADVLRVIEEEKDEIEVLVSLGAGDIENDVPQMKEILRNRKC